MESHFLFDEKLLVDCITYYKALDGRDLTPEEAERYLHSLADWYDWLVTQVSASPPSGGGERAKRAAPEPSS